MSNNFFRLSDIEIYPGLRKTSKRFTEKEIISDLRMVYELPRGKGLKILDVGCGTGRDLRILLRNFPDYYCVGIDHHKFNEISTEDPFFKFIEHDFTKSKLPFEDQSFDIVYANSVFAELTQEQVDDLLKEMKRVGKDVWYTELEKPEKTFKMVHATPFEFNKFIVTGCARTGTTLLTELLSALPDTHCFNEHLSMKFLHLPDFINVNKKHIGIKLPWLYDKIKKFDHWSNSKIIYTKRNPYDVISSLIERHNIAKGNSQNTYLEGVQEDLMKDDQISNFLNEFAYDDKLVASSAIYYKKTEEYSNYYECHRVEYSSLVKNTYEEIFKICEYLGSEFVHIDISKVYQTSVNKSRDCFTPQQLSIIERCLNG
jgi:SAM-dependent methyltransferase